MSTVRDVIGDPTTWSNCVSDEPEPLPDLNTATVVDVFVSASEMRVYMNGSRGSQALAIFQISDATAREHLVAAFQPGRKVHEALATPIQSGNGAKP